MPFPFPLRFVARRNTPADKAGGVMMLGDVDECGGGSGVGGGCSGNV